MKQLTLSTLLAAAMGSSTLSASAITDTVTVDGVEWAQVSLFVDLSWDKIDAVCPSGVCESESLNGYDMSGWTWASVDDLNSLGNSYIGRDVLGPGQSFYSEPDSAWAPAFYSDGWKPTSTDNSGVLDTEGLLSDVSGEGAGAAAQVTDIPRVLPEAEDAWSTFNEYEVDLAQATVGAWFYRESVSVSEPLSVSLFGLGLVALGVTRRRHLVRN